MAEINDTPWSLTTVIDKSGRVWQRKDTWICVTQGLDGGSPQSCTWLPMLEERWGPLTLVQEIPRRDRRG